MDETNLFLSSNTKKSKKKAGRQNTHQSKKNINNINNITINISNKAYLIMISFLIFTTICLFIIQIKLNKILKKKFLKEKENKKYKRLFLYKEDPIEEHNKKNQIHISLSIDNNFLYISLVSMASILENNDKNNNIIIFHLLLSHDFNTTSLDVYESLKQKYEVKINYYIIPHIFKKFRTWSGKTDTIYYKILIPLILRDLERIIFVDADTITFKDLLEMYNLPFNDNYVLGYPFQDVNKIDKFVKNATTYINSGVILLNIEKIANDDKDIELIQLTLEENANLWFPEQDAINVAFFSKVGILPLKYGIYLYGDIQTFERNYEHRLRIKLNKTELINAMEDPAIIHLSCCNPKVWHKQSFNDFGVTSICDRYRKEFYYYANKTNYYTEIYNRYMN